MKKRYSEIFRTAKGVVHKVVGKNMYQVEFGNLHIVFGFNSLQKFKDFIEETDINKLDDMVVSPSKKIIIFPPRVNSGYAFEKKEFLEFRELLLGTVSLLAIEKEITNILS
ncbi:DUF6686 family protein [Flexithrix dorotheae]|uniref:DUF6686 family protein n=1 Tax=Flexithrix dorotheae TaxID=70993 RepID=UPI00037A8709|nr:DUF6686 family protein [Flexithrix dorotheae]